MYWRRLANNAFEVEVLMSFIALFRIPTLRINVLPFEKHCPIMASAAIYTPGDDIFDSGYFRLLATSGVSSATGMRDPRAS